jgi:formylglycine-generating enzyme required for sulfatase activity
MKKTELVIMACVSGGLLSAILNGQHLGIQKDIGTISCHSNISPRFGIKTNNAPSTFSSGDSSVSHSGMARIPGGEFTMGCSDENGRSDEYPKHSVKVNSFWMDVTEVTNGQFQKFVEATGYVTTAEKAPDWKSSKNNYRQVLKNLTSTFWLRLPLYSHLPTEQFL